MLVHQFRQDVTANNIANVNTTGFKSSRVDLQENYAMSGAHAGATPRSLAPGAFLSTDRSLDMAVEGRGFFPVKTPSGTAAFTRDGTFHTDAEGNIVNSNGYRLDVDFTLPEGTNGLRISPDGFVYANSADGTRELGRISLAHFFNPQGLDASGNNLYLQSAASGPAVYGYPGENGFGRVLSGSLETSNVSLVQEMTDMIINQRGMEVNLKTTQTYDSMFVTLINMKR